MRKYYIYAIIGLAILTFGFVQTSPYTRRIRPFTSGFPVSCIENEVGYDMTSHTFGICDNSLTYKAILVGGGSGSFSNIFLSSTGRIEFAAGIGDPNIFSYSDNIGPKFLDGVDGNSLTFNLQSLSANRTLVVPDQNGTICTTTSVCSGYQAAGSYLVGSGAAGTIPIWMNGIELGNSSITYDGVTTSVSGSAFSILNGTTFSTSIGGAGVNIQSNVSIIGDWNSAGAGTKSVLDDSATTITNTAATSISNITPLLGTGASGVEFQIDGNGAITNYLNSPAANGELLIGRSSGGFFQKGILTAGTGISITNGAGSITIAQNGSAPFFSSGTPSIAGNGTLNSGSKDSAGKVASTGTGASTVVLTFSTTFTNAPACLVTNETTANLVRPVSTTTTLTLNATVVTGDKISYICLEY